SVPYNLSLEAGRPERFQCGQLSLGAFRGLGVQPALGGGFQAGDDEPGATSVVLLGNDLWRERYGGAADVVGRTNRANGAPLTVIRVTPPQFAFPRREALWVPLRVDPLATARGQGPTYPVLGLLSRGVTAEQATAQLTVV